IGMFCARGPSWCRGLGPGPAGRASPLPQRRFDYLADGVLRQRGFQVHLAGNLEPGQRLLGVREQLGLGCVASGGEGHERHGRVTLGPLIVTSPLTPSGTGCPWASTILTCCPASTLPTEPGFLGPRRGLRVVATLPSDSP